MTETTPNGIEFSEELVSSEGAAFILYPKETDTEEMIAAAKSYLKNARDVVSLRVASEEDLDDLYKSLYFRDPRTRELKWYQIEQEEKTIRQARKQGLTPEDFVTIHVLPYTQQVQARNEQRFGSSIYTF